MDAPALPPLTRQYPQWSRTGMLRLSNQKEFTSRIRVKKNPSNSVPEVFSPAGGSGSSLATPGTLDAVLRVGQLEQNIRFLQEQHALLLTGLHREIEAQRQMNRDLQFQLVFSKRKPATSTEASTSINDDSKTSPTTPTLSDHSPGTDDTPKPSESSDRDLCVKLEQELTSAKAALQTSLAKTADLQLQLQQYKNQEANTLKESTSRQIASSWSGAGAELPSVGAEEERELRGRLAEAERLVGGLRAQGERQRRELQSIKASLNAAGRGNAGGGGGSGRGGQRGGQQRFPPLQPPQHQAYWQQREPQKNTNITERPTSNKVIPSKSNVVAFGRTIEKSSLKTTPRNNVTVKIVAGNKEIKPKVISSIVLPKRQSMSARLQRNTLELSSPSVPTVSLADSDKQKNNEYGSWTRSHRRSGEKGEVNNGPAPALPDLRTSNAPIYNNGNSNNSNQGHSRRGGGNHGYSNHYFRNSDRAHRNGDTKNTEEDQQPRNFNTPADLSDGEVEQPTEGNSRGNYRNKRGQHRSQQDKS